MLLGDVSCELKICKNAFAAGAPHGRCRPFAISFEEEEKSGKQRGEKEGERKLKRKIVRLGGNCFLALRGRK